MELTKERARKLLKGDFIPGGKAVDVRDLTFRKTLEHEVFQCCARTGYDPQSGPFYCGDVAELVAEIEKDGIVTGVVALCNHRGHKLPPGVKVIE